MAQADNLTIEKWRQEDQKFSHLWLHREFEDSLNYMRPCLAEKKEKEREGVNFGIRKCVC